ncbi:MAG: sigma-70 family RNA polymerase sigma factor [Chitinophagaceae bacterium]
MLQEVWYQFSSLAEKEVISEVNAWLHRVARNKIIDKYRKKTSVLLDDLTYEDEEGVVGIKDILITGDSNPETEYLRQLFWEQLKEALDELPENQRNVFIWNELEERTFQEISGTTGENIKTLISRKGYAVKHLRKKLENLYEDFMNY